MTQQQAKQIVVLLNERNQLVKKYTAADIIKHKMNFVFLEIDNQLAACAECKKVQWYQWEISHVSVTKGHEGKGLGSRILRLAEQKAINGAARILQCTIRSNNERSQRLFLNKGYTKTSSFYYPLSGNWVNVYQKTVSVLES